MITKKSRKQEWERYFISGSILKVQKDGTEVVSLGSSSVIAEDKEGDDVSTTLLDQTTKKLDDDPKGVCNSWLDNMLSVRVQDGDEDLAPYKVTFRLETNQGNRYEVDMRIGVNEI